MNTLIIASHDNVALAQSTLQVVDAAKKIGGTLHILVAGTGCESVAKQTAAIAGIEKILLAEDTALEHCLAENMAGLIISLADKYQYILTAATSTGKDFMPRLAALLEVTQISEITQVLAPDTFKRPIYAGNAFETVQSNERIKVITVRHIAFNAAPSHGGNAPIETVTVPPASTLVSFVSSEAVKNDKPELTSAKIVVSGGRGLGSKENFALIEQLADKLGAAVGASRAAVDAGYIANDAQVGQTGKIVAPDLYIAVGISGAIQHLAGMKDSKTIVAINKDENAPVFEIADYGLVADLFEVLPEMIAKV